MALWVYRGLEVLLTDMLNVTIVETQIVNHVVSIDTATIVCPAGAAVRIVQINVAAIVMMVIA
ncbi:MAG: hypothetical protein ABGW78_15215 [Pirellulales bacterium]